MRLISLCNLMVFLVLLQGVTYAKSNTIYVNHDQPQFTITLDANRTTGYSWSLKNYDKKLISLVSHEYVQPNTKLIGAPGYEKWTFKASPDFFLGSKSAMVSLVYARPWEHGKGIKTVVYQIISK